MLICLALQKRSTANTWRIFDVYFVPHGDLRRPSGLSVQSEHRHPEPSLVMRSRHEATEAYDRSRRTRPHRFPQMGHDLRRSHTNSCRSCRQLLPHRCAFLVRDSHREPSSSSIPAILFLKPSSYFMMCAPTSDPVSMN